MQPPVLGERRRTVVQLSSLEKNTCFQAAPDEASSKSARHSGLHWYPSYKDYVSQASLQQRLSFCHVVCGPVALLQDGAGEANGGALRPWKAVHLFGGAAHHFQNCSSGIRGGAINSGLFTSNLTDQCSGGAIWTHIAMFARRSNKSSDGSTMAGR
eukprot:2702790-Amphidinium_carterae.1